MPDIDLISNGEIVLEGTIMPDDWCRYFDGGCFSARMVREALAEFEGDVRVRVNSPGGDPFEGEAARAALAAHPGTVHVLVAGNASSAASLMIMGANEIEMSAGSIIMVHNPSACICGTAAELRKEAGDLDVMAGAYARVYASRTGQTAEAIQSMMDAETYMGPEAAIEAGFADRVEGDADVSDPPEIQMARQAHQTALNAMQMSAERIRAAQVSAAVSPTATAGQTQVSMTATQEAHMPDEENQTAVATPATPATPAAASATPATPEPPQTTMQAPSPDTSAIEARAAEAERARGRGIREMAAPFLTGGQLTQAEVDALIDDGTPLEAAGNHLMASMARAETPVAPAAGATARITRDETDTRVEGMIAAMMRDFDGPGAEFRGIRVRGLAMELAGAGRGFSDTDRIRRGMSSVSMMGGAHGVSDFAYITTEVMNRTLNAEYDRRGAQWNIVTGTPMQASDFRELHAVRFGGDFQLKTVKENGEYQEATLADEAEGLKVERRGRTINLTFEAVINDDMGAFNRIPREFAIAARIMESTMVWGLLRSNAVLKSDSTALFHADHGNLASSGSAISVTSVGAARQAMWEQTAFGSEDPDDFLSISPDQLIVPPSLEVVAMQFATGTVPNKDSDTNPYKGTLTPTAVPNLGAAAGGSDTAWYLVSSDLPPISVAYLDGYEAPTVQTIEGMNPDKVTMNARHIFGSAPSEYRGSYKNPGV